jgi:hypothetical protein
VVRLVVAVAIVTLIRLPGADAAQRMRQRSRTGRTKPGSPSSTGRARTGARAKNALARRPPEPPPVAAWIRRLGRQASRPKLPTVAIDGRRSLTLYHGTWVPGIRVLDPARAPRSETVEWTVGEGTYFTSQLLDGEGYARVRAVEHGGRPIVYTTQIRNVHLADLRSDDAIDGALRGFARHLSRELTRSPPSTFIETNDWLAAIQDIETGAYRRGGKSHIKPVVHQYHLEREFTRYLRAELGYDGLVTMEGGEVEGAAAIGAHDTYVLFDPRKARVVDERALP